MNDLTKKETFEITQNLVNETKETILKGLSKAKNTQVSYECAKSQYLDFCNDMNLQALDLGSTLLFLQANVQKYKLSTLLLKSVAINDYLKENNLDLLSTNEFKTFRIGLQKTKNNVQKQAKAIQSKNELIESTKNIKNIKHKALILCGLYGAFRISELTNLKVSNLSIESQRITITTYKSKTNQLGNEELKSIPKSQNKSVCPYNALVKLIKSEGLANDMFLFNYSTMQANRIVKKYLGENYSTHSLRASFVTLSKKAGATNVQIKAQTKHKTDFMIDKYYRNENIHNENAVNLI